MLLPMKAVTLHMGRAHAKMAIIHPKMQREMPINSSPIDILKKSSSSTTPERRSQKSCWGQLEQRIPPPMSRNAAAAQPRYRAPPISLFWDSGHRDQLGQRGQDEGHPGSYHHPSLGRLVIHTVGAFCPHNGHHDSHNAQHDGDDSKSAGGLEVCSESQHGVVDFTLHLTCALDHAVHPDAFPSGLRCDDVHPDER
ncbi:hypothetical protein F7725_020370 [Dissostichus mawsoni]|uniref:Uncharacterized protein n=1 Tax=Dissostichus mawsoni TaxID=36200 RepID=A0A7J5YD31_DISMA|nr:hypothetical protein F7725_020370 [Dissostichus mawsoni]